MVLNRNLWIMLIQFGSCSVYRIGAEDVVHIIAVHRVCVTRRCYTSLPKLYRGSLNDPPQHCAEANGRRLYPAICPASRRTTEPSDTRTARVPPHNARKTVLSCILAKMPPTATRSFESEVKHGVESVYGLLLLLSACLDAWCGVFLQHCPFRMRSRYKPPVA